jgi:hypothetical protein
MYRAGSLREIGEDISKYKIDLVGVQEVRWDGGGTERADKYVHFSMEKGMKIMTGLFVHKSIISDFKKV